MKQVLFVQVSNPFTRVKIAMMNSQKVVIPTNRYLTFFIFQTTLNLGNKVKRYLYAINVTIFVVVVAVGVDDVGVL